MSTRLDELTFLDPEIQEWPFDAYERLQKEAPVFYDEPSKAWVVTRYDDIRQILTDPETFSTDGFVESLRDAVDPVRAAKVREIYRSRGWVPSLTLSQQDSVHHKGTRAIFQQALRAGRIRQLDPFIRQTAIDLVEKFRHTGETEIVESLAVPLPLIAICSQVGVPLEDIWKIKYWTDSWVRRFSMMLTEEEEIETVYDEIEFQHYFREIVADLQAKPNGTVLSDLVNLKLPDGRTLEYADIVTHLLADLFVGGSETSTNAISEGVLLLCNHADQYAMLMSDLDKYLPMFVEESLRLQSPVQGMYRITTREVELGDTRLPKGALVNVRFAAANRDAAHFQCPHMMDIERSNSGSHLAFGSGLHHCIGAPLARREIFWSFDALLRGVRNLRLAPGKNDFRHNPGLLLRSLKKLHIEFDPV
ncbi:MAG: cytochrome P450 [Sphingomonadaceae bacterium]